MFPFCFSLRGVFNQPEVNKYLAGIFHFGYFFFYFIVIYSACYSAHFFDLSVDPLTCSRYWTGTSLRLRPNCNAMNLYIDPFIMIFPRMSLHYWLPSSNAKSKNSTMPVIEENQNLFKIVFLFSFVCEFDSIRQSLPDILDFYSSLHLILKYSAIIIQQMFDLSIGAGKNT